jgi:hypothetical protein
MKELGEGSSEILRPRNCEGLETDFHHREHRGHRGRSGRGFVRILYPNSFFFRALRILCALST